MGTAIHQVLVKIENKIYLGELKLRKHYMMLNMVRLGWVQPTAPQCTTAVSHPCPFLSPSPFWEEGHSLFQCVARIRSDFAFWLSLHNFTQLVALTLVVWTFHSFLKNTQQIK